MSGRRWILRCGLLSLRDVLHRRLFRRGQDFEHAFSFDGLLEFMARRSRCYDGRSCRGEKKKKGRHGVSYVLVTALAGWMVTGKGRGRGGWLGVHSDLRGGKEGTGGGFCSALA